MAPTRFAALVPVLAVVVQHGGVVALGALPGTVSPGGDASQPSAPPGDRAVASGDYPILHLTLGGPLDLRLLGLNVQLDQFALDITATPDGGLLGALLSALLGGLATVLNSSAVGRLAKRRDR